MKWIQQHRIDTALRPYLARVNEAEKADLQTTLTMLWSRKKMPKFLKKRIETHATAYLQWETKPANRRRLYDMLDVVDIAK